MCARGMILARQQTIGNQVNPKRRLRAIEDKDEADEEAQLQRLYCNPSRDREMVEGSLDNMGAYDDNGENKFIA